MSLAASIAPYLSALLTDPTLRDAQRVVAELVRRVRLQPHRIRYFHQVDDPYSHLAAQTLERLGERYDVAVAPCLVAPPADDAAPDRDRLAAYARKDAADIAAPLGLDFPVGAAAPDPLLVATVTRTLAAAAPGSFARRAVALGAALWRGDAAAVAELARRFGADDDAAADAAVAVGTAERASLGHYLGATFHYGGEWYWGVDRLHYLEQRLQALGALRHGAAPGPIVAIPDANGAAPGRRGGDVVVDAFVSLRSPYSCIAMERLLSLPRRFPVAVRWRPVLPMVMRGLPVPLAKRLYIVRDTKREADRIGVPFGLINDPVGAPVERGFGLWRWAQAQGRGGEYLHAFLRAAFAEGVDTGSDAGLRHVVEAAGLAWSEAQHHVDATEWRAELEANRAAMLDLGLWGVPSFRVSGGDRPPFATWGQDRLWLVEREIAARLPAG